MVTIRDIAKASGVSVATVSYVLNNGPRPVHPETRERVRGQIDRLGYHPSAIARSLFSGRTNTVGVVLYTYGTSNPVASPYFAQVLGGILESAARLRKSTMLMLEPITEDSAHHIGMYCDGRSDGLLFVAPPETPKIVQGMAGRKVPYILLSDSYADPNVATMDIDNFEAARKMVHYLIQKGHRRIAFFNGDDRLDSAASRDLGYRQALADAGLQYDRCLDVKGLYTGASGDERARFIFKLPLSERPTAIFCGSDQIALGVLSAAREMNIRVPDEISIAGFDDVLNAAESNPPLTTIRQPLFRMGVEAVEMLFDCVNGAELEKRIFETEIIERGSVAEPHH